MSESRIIRDEKGRIVAGSGGIGGGRPLGARAKLGEEFCSAMLEDFERHGQEAIRRFREKDPAGYSRAIVAMLPKNFALDVNQLKTVQIDMLGCDLPVEHSLAGAGPKTFLTREGGLLDD